MGNCKHRGIFQCGPVHWVVGVPGERPKFRAVSRATVDQKAFSDANTLEVPPNKSLHWPPGVSVTVLARSILIGRARTAPDTGASELKR